MLINENNIILSALSQFRDTWWSQAVTCAKELLISQKRYEVAIITMEN